MVKLRLDQHAQILGFAIIGFGIALLLGKVQTMWILAQGTSGSAALWPDILVTWALFLISLFAGLTIKWLAFDPKTAGLAFVIVAIGTFPLGTIVGVYALVYLFVIYPGEIEGYLNSKNNLTDQ
jgi:hypothetical protein